MMKGRGFDWRVMLGGRKPAPQPAQQKNIQEEDANQNSNEAEEEERESSVGSKDDSIVAEGRKGKEKKSDSEEDSGEEGEAEKKKPFGKMREFFNILNPKKNKQDEENKEEANKATCYLLLFNIERLYHYYWNTIEGQVMVDQLNKGKVPTDEDFIHYNTKDIKWRAYILALLKDVRAIIHNVEKEIEQNAKKPKNEENQESNNPYSAALLNLELTINNTIGSIQKNWIYGGGSRLAKVLKQLLVTCVPKENSENEDATVSKDEIEEAGGVKEAQPEPKNKKLSLDKILILSEENLPKSREKDITADLARVLMCVNYYLNTSYWQEFNKKLEKQVPKNQKDGWADVAERLEQMILRLYVQKPINARQQLVKILATFANEIRKQWFGGKNSDFAKILEVMSLQIKGNKKFDIAIPESNKFTAVLSHAPTTIKYAEIYIQGYILNRASDIVLEYEQNVAKRWSVVGKKKQVFVSDTLNEFANDSLNNRKKAIKEYGSIVDFIEGKFNEGTQEKLNFYEAGKFDKLKQQFFGYTAKIKDELSPTEREIIPEKYTLKAGQKNSF